MKLLRILGRKASRPFERGVRWDAWTWIYPRSTTPMAYDAAGDVFQFLRFAPAAYRQQRNRHTHTILPTYIRHPLRETLQHIKHLQQINKPITQNSLWIFPCVVASYLWSTRGKDPKIIGRECDSFCHRELSVAIWGIAFFVSGGMLHLSGLLQPETWGRFPAQNHP